MAWQGAESTFPGAAPPGPRAPRTCSAWRQHILQAERIVGSRGARLVVTVSLLALDKERTRHDGRARSPLCSKGSWSRRHPTVTLSSCSAPVKQRPARGEPGGNAGQHAPSPGLDSRAEIELGPGRGEEGPREEGPGPAAPRSPGGTRTGGASPPLPPPQLSGSTGPEAKAQASSFCFAHSPRLLPLPSKTRSGNQTLRKAGASNAPVTPIRPLTACLTLLSDWGRGREPMDKFRARGCISGLGPERGKEPSPPRAGYRLE